MPASSRQLLTALAASMLVASMHAQPPKLPELPEDPPIPEGALERLNEAIYHKPTGGEKAEEASDEGKEFAPSTPDQIKKLAEFAKSFQEAGSAPEKADLLKGLQGEPVSNAILPLITAILGAPANQESDPVKEQAIKLISGNSSPEILEPLQSAVESSNPDLRVLAVLAASHVQGEKFELFLAPHFKDSDQEVRKAALDTLEFQPDATKLPLLGKALTSDYLETAKAALEELQKMGTKAVVPIIMLGLKAPKEEIRKDVSAFLQQKLGRKFTSYSQAEHWWRTKHDKISDNIFE